MIYALRLINDRLGVLDPSKIVINQLHESFKSQAIETGSDAFAYFLRGWILTKNIQAHRCNHPAAYFGNNWFVDFFHPVVHNCLFPKTRVTTDHTCNMYWRAAITLSTNYLHFTKLSR